MGYYDPPEPEAEGTDTFTCSMEVERKFITPTMTTLLTELHDGKVPDPWSEARTEKEREAVAVRWREQKFAALIREWKATEEVVRSCGWSGEADYVVWQGAIHWDCPACGESHSDESAEDRWGPDPDYYREMAAEMEFDRMREDAVIERLRDDEAGI